MTFNKGDRVSHSYNPLGWRGVVTEVKLDGCMKVMLTTGIEVEVNRFVPLQFDVFTDDEIKEFI
jgi:hypothetical protein